MDSYFTLAGSAGTALQFILSFFSVLLLADRPEKLTELPLHGGEQKQIMRNGTTALRRVDSDVQNCFRT